MRKILVPVHLGAILFVYWLLELRARSISNFRCVPSSDDSAAVSDDSAAVSADKNLRRLMRVTATWWASGLVSLSRTSQEIIFARNQAAV